jgi:hypothetical protein
MRAADGVPVAALVYGQTVRIDAPCLDCGEPIAVEMRDEDILAVEPGGIVGYAYDQIGGPAENRPYR